LGTTLSEFYTRLRGPLGRNDAVGDKFIEQGVNFGCVLTALLFDPPELSTSGSLTVTALGTSVSLSTLTRPRTIKSVYNATSSLPIWSIEYRRLDFVVPVETGHVRFYSREGDTLYVKPAPTVENTLTAYYNQFPLAVSSSNEHISIEDMDPMIESYALAYAMGCLEETEQAQFWAGLGEKLMVPEAMLLQARKYLEGGPQYGNNKG
jgi:hypothetical protein